MLFSAKSKGFFIDYDDHQTTVARTSSLATPLVVEEILECEPGNEEALAAILAQLQPKKAPSGYVHAVAGVYGPRRVVRRATLDLKRVKEPNYLSEVVSSQFRIESDEHMLAVLGASDGCEFDATKTPPKEVIFCGLPNAEITRLQEQILATKVFPERLELGSVAALGALVDYLSFVDSKTPTLMLEVGAETTHSFIVSAAGVDASRPIPQGLDSMIPVVQKELGLKDEASAKKLFFSNTFDFTGMGPTLIKKLLKELQSSIGFYEVQTGQSIGQVICTVLPSKLSWLEAALASQLGVAVLKLDLIPWLQSRQITLSPSIVTNALDARRLGLFGLMAQFKTRDAVDPKKV